jgi:hypothetical protein
LLPQELGLVIKEFVHGDEVGNYVVQKVFLVAAPFQVSHATCQTGVLMARGKYLIGVGTRCSS